MAKTTANKSRFLTRVSARGLCAAALAFAPAVAAQDQTEDPSSPDDTGRGNEIIVTARSQGETLQEVPVAVSVINSAALETARIDEAADIIGRVPTLNVQIG